MLTGWLVKLEVETIGFVPQGMDNGAINFLSNEIAFPISSDDGVYGDDQEICGGAWSLDESDMPSSKIPDSGSRYYSTDHYYSYYYAENGNIYAVPSRDTGTTIAAPAVIGTSGEADFENHTLVSVETYLPPLPAVAATEPVIG